MNTSEFYAAGLVEKGEEIAYCFKVNLLTSNGQQQNGFLVLTNKRFLFVQRPSGFFSKGFDVLISTGWNDVSSVSTSGLLSKRVNVTVRSRGIIRIDIFRDTIRDTTRDTTKILQFTCDGVEQIKSMITKQQLSSDGVEQIAEKMAVCKRNYVEPTTIEATKVVIEEANKDKDTAMVILQKRLAKGEITLEEFHKLITRL